MKSKLLVEMLKVRGTKYHGVSLPGVLVNGNGLTVTNLERYVTYHSDIKDHFPYTFTPDEKFYSLCKTAKEIEIFSYPDAQDRKARITAEGIGIEIPCEPLEEYPPIPQLSEQDIVPFAMMPWAEFCEKMIRATVFAAEEKVHFSLHGVCFDFTAGKPGNIVGTDGKRLSIIRGPVSNRDIRVIVPRAFFKTFYQITKIEKPEYVRIFAHEKVETEQAKIEGEKPPVEKTAPKKPSYIGLWFTAGNFTFYTMLIDGTFPDYMKAVPKSEVKMTTTIGPAQKSVLEKASKFSTDELKGLEISRNKLVIAGIEFPQVFTFEGEMEFRPKFNPDFLLEFTDEDFDVEFRDDKTALVLHAPDACYAVMPIVYKSKQGDVGERISFETGEYVPTEEEIEKERQAAEEAAKTPAETPAETPAA